VNGRRLVVLDASFGDITVETAAAAPYGVTLENAGGVSGPQVVEVAGTADGVLVQYGKIDADLIAACPSWRVIGRYGVGVDNVDVDAATRHGIAVINVPDYCIEEVATHTAALALAGRRKLARSRELIDAGRWGDWSELRPIEPLSGCTLGLVGIGRIGGEVVRLLGPFFGRVIAYDPVQAPPPNVTPVGLDELFAESDVVSLHCPLTPETQNLVDADRLASMKPGAYLVNVSRGGLVDTAALATALATGTIAGAGLDVLPQEPPDASDPLLEAPNLLLTNHSAWYSELALVRLRRFLAERCGAYLNGEPVSSIVNARALAAAAG
jgi:D-3-phosphoglycerate dehydrogenase / 2-oxoglutarate reductase